MLVIYLVFYLGTMILLFSGIKRRTGLKEVLFSKNDSEFLKGMAAIMVFLAHSQDFLVRNGEDSILLKPFSVLGGMGVLIFFALSGYGIYKGYANKEPSISFWKNRFLKMFIPACVISAFSCFIIYFGKKISFFEFVCQVFNGQWYVDVVMLEYLIFFISWIISKKNLKLLFIIDIISNFILVIIFYQSGFDARWYNGLMLFPIGMFLAALEKKILQDGKKNHEKRLAVSLFIFCVSGIIYVVLKGELMGDFVKSLAGVFLVLLLAEILYFGELGNSVIKWIGKRSLYIYLCHMWLLGWILDSSKLMLWINGRVELGIFILLIGTIIYTEMAYLVLNKF